MKKKRERIHIEVDTIKNGYGLKVDGDDYMYFDERGLLEGFVYHVGLHKRGTGERDKIANIVKAMETWPDASQVTYEAADTKLTAVSLRAKNEHLTAQVRSMSKTIERLERELTEMKADRTQMQRKMAKVLNDTNDMISEQYIRRDDVFKEQKPKVVAVVDCDDVPVVKKHPGGRPKGVTPEEIEKRLAADHDSDKRTQRREKMKKHAQALMNAANIEYSEEIYKIIVTPLMDTGVNGNIITHIAVDPSMKTVGDVAIHPRQYFVGKRGCGKGSIEAFEAYLHEHGLAFGMDVNMILMEHAKRWKNRQ